MSRWYVVIEGIEDGPIGSERLKEMASSGIVNPDTKIRNESQTEWSLAKNVKGLVFLPNDNSPADSPSPIPNHPIPALPTPPSPPVPRAPIARQTAASSPSQTNVLQSALQPTLLACLVLTQFCIMYILKPHTRFEYRIEAPGDEIFQTVMDGYGRDGWEVVSARRATSLGDPAYEVILKRGK